jgi:carbamoyltransferase
MDGVGEWATTSVWLGDKNTLTPQWQIDFPHSLGLLYSAFTYYTGFRVNSGEYKLMGLAPYGDARYVDLILDNVLDLKKDGTFRLDMSYFNYATGLRMTSKKLHKLFGGEPRKPETELTQKEMDIARSIQWVAEEIVLKLGNTIQKELEVDHLCLAGGVALNCVANGRLIREGPFTDVWIQPAAGDAGGALGAALSIWHSYLEEPRLVDGSNDCMGGAYLGCHFTKDEIQAFLDSIEAPYVLLDESTLMEEISEHLGNEKVIGWFSGRMEFGPRALGARSIIGDARSVKMQSIMNLKIKYRESFRPFAPVVKSEKVSDWFETDRPSPYMLVVSGVKENKRRNMTETQNQLFGIDKLNIPRSEIPAVTHIDYSARVQTVHSETNPRLHRLIGAFEKKTGCPVLVNTSFNVRGEPIVCTPEDAYKCFMRTEMDYLVLENFVLAKSDQPDIERDESWKDEFELD